MNVEPWFWVWVAFAAVLYLAELLTPGHWMLPFALGSTLAAALGIGGAGIVWQWGAFLGVTSVALVALRRMVSPAGSGPTESEPADAEPAEADPRGQAVTKTEPSRTVTG